ncbi:double-strand break repair protein AddB [Roseospira visakhapatnamensis]|uniref:ATP-dependent helicase/nuclease subunit B n=1 Tax=Roseospira visakhapatnamensis TaxID=390880 RepID=A0A7W6RA18_9PROT|nr:double-strand break repair protein AddB [Roseospira visakhapatnamensis]MBB4264715.1 ATP-dependent helicase/nuclease subunit B [Roseospira visakhapatnamensis]
MTGAASRVFTIDPGRPFVDALAAGLLDRYRGDRDTGGDPLALAAVTILLPTRRACRALREAFLRRGGGRALLLPRMLPLGDVDEDDLVLEAGAGLMPGEGAALADLPPAVSDLRRRLLLARLVAARPLDPGGRPPTPDQAAWLAADLGRLLDQVQTERVSLGALAGLAPERFAAHWQITVRFLAVLSEVWPGVLEAEGCLDPADRRDRLMTAQATRWTETPPPGPVIAAGSTGSIPATADLLAVVAALPRGAVVLPGLDRTMDEASWAALDPTHPQYGLRGLLARLGVDRRAVADWPASLEDTADPKAAAGRRALIAEAMRPAATTDAWREARPLPSEALAGVARLTCPGPREEAEAIALMMRETLEHPGRTAALVTLDRDLARRVAASLDRWGVALDDSAGQPLGVTEPGGILRLLARATAEDLAPGPLLDLLRHPLAAGGQDEARFRAQGRRLELRVLRGPRPPAGIDGLRRVARARGVPEGGGLIRVLDRLERILGPLVALMAGPEVPLRLLVETHMACAEALAASDDTPGPMRLWAGPAGEAAALFAADLITAAEGLPPLAPRHYPGLLDALMVGRVVRPPQGGHPRLSILGPLEARAWHADHMILGGLNEGSWPPAVAADPWMSRPMRAAFGLSPPEHRVGLSAHDFTQAFCAPRVTLTRADRVEGTPTVPSRWLLRLDAATQATGLGAAWRAAAARGASWLALGGRLRAVAAVSPAPPPAPTPPVEARPGRLSVTRVETWMRDPYGIYARFILGLEALDALDRPLGVQDYGMLVHDALERFRAAWPEDLPPDPEAELLRLGRAVFEAHGDNAAVAAFWWPRFVRTARWVIDQERARAGTVRRVRVEVAGDLALSGVARPFTLTARADRVEETVDGDVVVVDYKTGAPPTGREVLAGYAPQLPLEAAMVAAGAFPGIPPAPVVGLEYWRLGGGRERPGEIRPVAGDAGDLARRALDGLTALVNLYARPETPYPARPVPDVAPRYSDYEHLARVREWAAAGEEGE